MLFPAHRQAKIDESKLQADRTIRQKEAAKQAKKALNHGQINVGDIYYSSWGYNQTNINFYKVIAKHGTKTVEFIEIGCNVVETGNMCGQASPDPKIETGKPFKKIMHSATYFNLDSYCSISKYDGKPKYMSWYA